MNTKDYWKIFDSLHGHVVLTDCPKTHRLGGIMKSLQEVYGWKMNGQQKFDERFDKIEDFDIILRTGYNLDGTRLVSSHLFEYDKKTNTLKVDNRKTFKIVENNDGYVYRIQKTQIKSENGWDGFRKHILWTMGDDSCWRHWGDAQFGDSFFKD